ncbi:MAG: antibiotic biosynthesis monooxygenase [Actinobacteria bacterium]|nr:antibiotic biosynthesis monooxygenase [Actinomycetota bacterium]
MTQVNLIATIPTPPEKNEAVTALLVEYQEVVVAEPGNLRFELYRDPAGTSVIVVERYASDEAFQAHCSTEANATLNARLAEVLDGGGSALQMLEAIDA